MWLHERVINPHLQPSVGCDDGDLIVDSCDVDVNGAGQTVLPDFSLVGHKGEIVAQRVTPIMDIGDVLTLQLDEENMLFKFQENTHSAV